MELRDLKWGTETASNIFIAFTAIAVWSSVPLTLRILLAVKQYRSLYFYALILCSWGLSVRGVGYMLQYFSSSTPWIVSVTISQLGWIFMVSGFATVLWSRLGFIIENDRMKRRLLWMIIFNGVVFHTAMTVISFVVNTYRRDFSSKGVANLAKWTPVQAIFERVQIVCFCGQEIAILSLYILTAHQYLRNCVYLDAQRKKVREGMFLLLGVQAVVISADVALITIDFLGLIKLKGFVHSFVYCMKLEFEFVVLSQLIETSRLGLSVLPVAMGSIRIGPEADNEGNGRRDSHQWSSMTLKFLAGQKTAMSDL